MDATELAEVQAEMRLRVRMGKRNQRQRSWRAEKKPPTGLSTQCQNGVHELDCPKLDCKCNCHADEYQGAN